MTILLSFLLLWTVFSGGTNTNNQSHLTGKVGFNGTPLLAQLHQEWLDSGVFKHYNHQNQIYGGICYSGRLKHCTTIT